MNNLNFNHNLNEIKTINNKSVNATLLISKMYLKTLEELRYKEAISIEGLITKFAFLIEKKILIIPPNLDKHTTLYQGIGKEKLNLIRCHLRCNPMVWHHWKRLANHFGVSMCNLFFICLKNVTSNDIDSVGTPTESIKHYNYLFFEVTNFARAFTHRWFFSKIYIKKKRKTKFK